MSPGVDYVCNVLQTEEWFTSVEYLTKLLRTDEDDRSKFRINHARRGNSLASKVPDPVTMDARIAKFIAGASTTLRLPKHCAMTLSCGYLG